MLDSWYVYLTLYMMMQCWTHDMCIWHNTEWRHVGLVICVSDIIQNDDGLVICVSAIIQNDNMLDSWSMYLALYRMMLDSWSVHLTYRMTPCWTRDLCIWHTEWLHVGLVICVSDIIQNDDGLVICVSAIIQNDNMLDSWSVYLPLYRMTTCWTRDLCIWHYTEWCWTCDLCIWHDTEWWWTRDLCIWHFTEWRHVGLVICVSDIIQNDGMLDLWSVYLTLYRMMMDSWSVYLPLYRMTTCWTRDLCIWHFTEWRHVGLVICVSDILQNDAMLDSWSVYLTLYRMASCWTSDLYLTLYRMTPCWTRDVYLTLYMMMQYWTHDLCIWHFTEWRHVGLVIYVSGIIQNDVGLVICASDIIQNDAMLDSWSVYLTYRMTPCRTRDLCIWHYTEWRHVGLMICVSDIQNDSM